MFPSFQPVITVASFNFAQSLRLTEILLTKKFHKTKKTSSIPKDYHTGINPVRHSK